MPYTAKNTRYDTMAYRRCGSSGLKLPAVSLGLWHNFGTYDSYGNMRQLCRTAFDHGITHFDLANNYGPDPGSAEENFGRLLRDDLAPYRDELVISTKAGYDMWPGPYGDGGSRKYLLASLDQSLRRMGIEYVDIFYHHRMDPDTPIEESMLALDSAVKSGKALYAGISNYDREHTAQAMEILSELHCPFIINQCRYSLLDRHIEADGLKAFAAENGCGLIAYSPLEQGVLTDRYLHGIPADSRAAGRSPFLNREQITPERLRQVQRLREVAALRGQTLAQMALSWVLRDGEVTSVLVGASRPEQILDNLGILGHTAFSQPELAAIEKALSDPPEG